MMNWTRRVSFCFGLLATPLLASGTGLFDPGAQGSGNVGAFTARAEDATAMYYNPAGLAQLEFNELIFSGKGITARSYYSNPGQSNWRTDTYVGVLPQLFFSAKVGRLSFGLGTAPSYYWDFDWEDADFPSRYLANGSEFSSQDGYASVAFKLTDHFSIGGTFRMVQADSKFSRVRVQPIPDSDNLFYEMEESFDGDGDGTGFILGLQYYRGRSFSIGASYQSEVELDFDGRRSFEILTRTQEPRVMDLFEQNFTNADYQETFTIPARTQIGLASRLTVRTRLEVDLTHQDWSDYGQTEYRTTDVDGQSTQVVIPRNWNESYSIRIAGDFLQRKAWLWRMGIAAIDRVVPSENLRPDFPNNDQFLYAFGVSYLRSERYIFEAGLVYAQTRDRRLEEKEFIFDPTAPDYLSPSGQEGLIESQEYRLTLGMRIRLGASKKRN